MCRALEEQGTETVIVSTDHGLETSEQTETFKGVKTIFFPAQVGESFKYSRPLTNWLIQNVSAFEVVHIHAVFNHACFAAARACLKQQVPYIVRPLGTLSPWGMNQKSVRKTLFWQLAGKRMLSRAAAVHYTALAEKVATEKSLGLNHGRVIPLGVNVENNDPIETNAQAQLLKPYVLVLSRLHPKKGLDVFLDAFLSVIANNEFAHWRLVLAGDGPKDYIDLLQSKAKTAGESVVFTGWLQGQTKNAFLRNAALLSLPSYDENFGLCVMEAMACGVPVLVSPHVNIAQDIKAAKSGWISEVDHRSLKDSLVEVFRSPQERAKRGQAGQKLASGFTWPRIALQLNCLYTELTINR